MSSNSPSKSTGVKPLVKRPRVEMPENPDLPEPTFDQPIFTKPTQDFLPPTPFTIPENDQIGDFELQNIVTSLPNNPTIEVILIIHDRAPAFDEFYTNICEKLATDFHADHLNIGRYLLSLRDSRNNLEVGDALGLLHPIGLEEYLKQNSMPAVFLMPILLRWFHSRVALGKRRFIISDFVRWLDIAVEFSKKIAMPVSLILFQDGSSSNQRRRYTLGELERVRKDSKLRRGVESYYKRVLLVVPTDEQADEKETYSRLLAAMFEMVLRAR
ncbi:Hypothetical protein R9X50_00647900 [Acrodontium crateriforme]|uniref:Uncharacterized protein n=1 Tax=Acrodontium crateriforme TaxID=150365 RepID=A0AAQ3M7Y4_9PEZI|nr:Hypothetical protein R9X50_00647900 [Acrodontium crateriforme]